MTKPTKNSLPAERKGGTQETTSANSKRPEKLVVLLIVAAVAIALFLLSRRFFDLDYLSQFDLKIRDYYAANPITVYSIAFLIYVLVTGFSIPGATLMSLVYAWFFGFWRGLILISFASTAGATLAFLLSRYLFRDWIQSKFGERLKTFNESLDKDGAFYLFSLRLVPVVPFFVINAVMGLTRIKAVTFWWVSQIGMLAGTAVYVYAGSRIPDLQTLASEGAGAIFTSSQLTQLAIAFALLGLFPLVVKKVLARFASPSSAPS